jgi:hypothetical protein
VWTRVLLGAFNIHLICLLGCSTGSRGRLPAMPESPAFEVEAQSERELCRSESFQLRSFQFLLDDSGSMKGFQNALLGATRGVDAALSRLLASRSNTDTVEFTNCLFGLPGGIRCRPARPSAEAFQGVGDTALDQAAAAATGYDLTVILTDGIAATATGAAKECAGGVDAVCVASQLIQSLLPATREEPIMNGGAWLVPVRLAFAGTVYTEQSLPVAAFRKDEAQAAAEIDMGMKVTIQRPTLSSSGQLQFQYAGDRYAVLMIVAKRAEIGRMAIRAIAGAGLASGTPIELFPGLPESPADFSLAPLPGRRGSKNFSLYSGHRVDCDDSALGQLTLVPPNREAGACTKIISLPALRLYVGAPAHAHPVSHAGLQYPVATIACDDIPRCASGRTSIRYSASIVKDKTLAKLQSPGSTDLLRRYHTLSLAQHPHRILAFSDLLSAFYQSERFARLPDWHKVDLCK